AVSSTGAWVWGSSTSIGRDGSTAGLSAIGGTGRAGAASIADGKDWTASDRTIGDSTSLTTCERVVNSIGDSQWLRADDPSPRGQLGLSRFFDLAPSFSDRRNSLGSASGGYGTRPAKISRPAASGRASWRTLAPCLKMDPSTESPRLR